MAWARPSRLIRITSRLIRRIQLHLVRRSQGLAWRQGLRLIWLVPATTRQDKKLVLTTETHSRFGAAVEQVHVSCAIQSVTLIASQALDRTSALH